MIKFPLSHQLGIRVWAELILRLNRVLPTLSESGNNHSIKSPQSGKKSIISEKISKKNATEENRDISIAVYEIFPPASIGFIKCNFSSGISREIER